MKNIIVLHYKDGFIKEVRWGNLPGEWHVPMVLNKWRAEMDPATTTSTLGKLTFVLQAKVVRGHLWWKKIYGHYTEEDVECTKTISLFHMWEKNRKSK